MSIRLGEPAGLIFMLAFGAVCAIVAQTRGRNSLGWFVIGFFTTCIGLIVLLVLPDVQFQEERHQRLATENRRLRERISKERMVADRRYAETHRRIDQHDGAIGIDTTVPPEELAALTPPPLPGEEASWFYLDATEQRGPVAISVLRRLWEDREVGPRTYVWRDGMADWKEIRDLPELGERFGA